MLKHAEPLDGLQVTKISLRDIASLIGSVKEKSGPVNSNRVRSSLSAFFSWAMSEGIGLETNPVINTKKSEEKPRERVLKDHELHAIWKHAGADHYGSVIKLLMLTGQRADEIASLRSSEIVETTISERRVTDQIRLPQFNIKAIELPAERTKNKRPHIVPLSSQQPLPRRTAAAGKQRRWSPGIRVRHRTAWIFRLADLQGTIG